MGSIRTLLVCTTYAYGRMENERELGVGKGEWTGCNGFMEMSDLIVVDLSSIAGSHIQRGKSRIGVLMYDYRGNLLRSRPFTQKTQSSEHVAQKLDDLKSIHRLRVG